jgi:hypothetical protein
MGTCWGGLSGTGLRRRCGPSSSAQKRAGSFTPLPTVLSPSARLRGFAIIPGFVCLPRAPHALQHGQANRKCGAPASRSRNWERTGHYGSRSDRRALDIGSFVGASCGRAFRGRATSQ